MSKPTVIAIVNQKGGTGKTCTAENLGVGLAASGRKVLLVDFDPQGSLTISLGYPRPDELSPTISDVLAGILREQSIPPGLGILRNSEGVELMPANIELSGLEVSLVNAMSRETILRQYLDTVKRNYDVVLIDCSPSLGMLTVNALAAADSVIIPVQAQYLSAKGLEQLLGTINRVKRQINPRLRIEGVLLTMVDSRTNYGRDISSLIRDSVNGKTVEMLEDNGSVSALVPLTVINTANFELPKTGGRGNKLLYGMGILALLAAVGSAVILTRKRRA